MLLLPVIPVLALLLLAIPVLALPPLVIPVQALPPLAALVVLPKALPKAALLALRLAPTTWF